MEKRNNSNEEYGGDFESLAAAIPDIVYRIGEDGKFTYLNNAIRTLGYEPNELIGKHFSKLILPADVKAISRKHVLSQFIGKVTGDKNAPKLFDERRSAERKTSGLEVRVVHKGGKKVLQGIVESIGQGYLTAEVSSSGVYQTVTGTNSKVFIGTVGVIKDITSHRWMEAELTKYSEHLEELVTNRTDELTRANKQLQEVITELKESEEKYRTLYETMVQGVIYHNADGKITSINPAGERILGITLEQMQSGTVKNSRGGIQEDGSEFPTENHPAFVSLKTGKPAYDVIMGMFNPVDQTYHWLNMNAVPQFRPGENRPYQVYSTFEDITERKKAEVKIRESEAFNTSLLENAPNPLHVINPDLSIKYVNPALAKLTGLSITEILGIKPPYPWWPEEKRKEYTHIFQDIVKEGTVVRERLYQKQNGEPFWVEVSVTAVKDKGELKHYLSNWVDITERKRMEEALQQEKAFAGGIIDTAQAIILVLDKEGCITEFNPYMEEISGYRLNEVLGQDWFNTFLPERIRMQVRTLFKQAINDIQTKGNVNQIITRDGRELDIEWYDKTLKDENGTVIGLLAVGQDITERKHAEEKLKESEENFRQSLGKSPVGIRIVTADGDPLYTNRAIVDIYGYESTEELEATPRKVLFTPDSYADHLERVARRKRGERVPSVYELNINRKDGSIRHLLVSRAEVFWNGEKQFQMVYQDITERKKAEETLRVSEERLKESQALGKIASYEIDLNTSHIIWSDEMYVLFERNKQLDPPDFDEITDYFSTEEFDRYAKLSENAISGGTQVSDDIIAKLPSGKNPIFHITVRPIKDNTGHVIKVFGIIQDITEQKRAEKQMTESRQELHSLYRRLLTLREEERAQVAGTLHDELGQAMTALKMDLSWLAKRLPKGELTLLGKIASLSELTDTIAETVRRISTELRPGLLDDLGLAAAIEWQSEEFAKRSGINCNCACSAPDIKVDRDKATAVFRILQELLTNISRHARATEVMVSLAEKGDIIELKVIDNGIGIAEEAVNSNQSFGLIGIRERANAFGGDVTFTGIPGKGTTITVQIPLQG